MDDVKDLRTFSLDIEKGTLVVNGEEIKKVTAFTLVFENGKYGLNITRDVFFKAKVPNI